MDALSLQFIQDQYKKIQLIKESDKGKVWLVTDTDGDLFVMKHINHIGLPLKLLQDHPSPFWPKIILLGEDTENNFTIVVEEYIKGRVLSEIITEKAFTDKELNKLLKAFCQGIKNLHQLGIIHRDIKPSNVIITDTGVPVLIDFDSARRISSEEKPNDTVLLGTKGYAPPEQFGYAVTDVRSDIYALGITFEALLKDDYQGTLRPIIKKCRAFDPDMRYQNVDEILRDLQFNRLHQPIIGISLSFLLIIFLAFSLYFSKHSQQSIPSPITSVNEQQSENPKNVDANTANNTTDQPYNTNSQQTASDIDSKEAKLSPKEKAFLEKYQLRPGTHNFIDMEINVPGSKYNTIVIPYSEYSTWEKSPLPGNLDYCVTFPENWYIEVIFTNNSTVRTWENPVVDIEYERISDDYAYSETRTMPDLAPGQSYPLRYSLGGRKARARFNKFSESGSGGSVDIDFHPHIPKADNIMQNGGGISFRIHFRK